MHYITLDKFDKRQTVKKILGWIFTYKPLRICFGLQNPSRLFILCKAPRSRLLLGKKPIWILFAYIDPTDSL